VPSREISPDPCRSRRLRDAPNSRLRKAPTAIRNAAHTRSGGVSTARSLSTGLTPFSPRDLRRPGHSSSGRRPRPRPARARAGGNHTRSGSRGPHGPGPPRAPRHLTPQGLCRHGSAVAGPQGRTTVGLARSRPLNILADLSSRVAGDPARVADDSERIMRALAATASRCQTRVAASDGPGRPVLREDRY